MNLVDPMFLASNRVVRDYMGGALLEEFAGMASPADGETPEDWPLAVAPTDEASAASVRDDLDRQKSDLATALAAHGESILGPEHVNRFGPTLGFEVRLMDTLGRRPIQVNLPAEGDDSDAPEVVVVLATREPDGQVATVLLGLEEDLDDDAFARLASEGGSGLEARMHAVPASPGHTFLLPPGLPYAIGPGVFVARVRPEGLRTVPIGEATEQQIDRTVLSQEELAHRCQPREMILHRSDEGAIAEALGSDRTTAFNIWQVEVAGRQHLKLPREFGFVLCEAGEGRMHWPGGSRELRRGEYFLQPYGVPWIEFAAYDRLRLLVVLPPAP